MKLYLLDTNTVSYFVKGQYPLLRPRMTQAIDTQEVAVSAITRAEIRYGQALMAANDRHHARIDLLLEQLPVLPWTSAAADRFGGIRAILKRQGTPIGEMDTLIAAHALAEKLILVTHNTRHFKNVPGLQLEDWTT